MIYTNDCSRLSLWDAIPIVPPQRGAWGGGRWPGLLSTMRKYKVYILSLWLPDRPDIASSFQQDEFSPLVTEPSRLAPSSLSPSSTTSCLAQYITLALPYQYVNVIYPRERAMLQARVCVPILASPQRTCTAPPHCARWSMSLQWHHPRKSGGRRILFLHPTSVCRIFWNECIDSMSIVILMTSMLSISIFRILFEILRGIMDRCL